MTSAKTAPQGSNCGKETREGKFMFRPTPQARLLVLVSKRRSGKPGSKAQQGNREEALATSSRAWGVCVRASTF